MCSNRLPLNAGKTEVMWCTSTHKQSQRPSSPLPVAGALVQPVDAVRDLGDYTDCDLGASTRARRTVSRYFAALRQLRQLRRYVTDNCFLSLVVSQLSLVHTRLDCHILAWLAVAELRCSLLTATVQSLRITW